MCSDGHLKSRTIPPTELDFDELSKIQRLLLPFPLFVIPASASASGPAVVQPESVSHSASIQQDASPASYSDIPSMQ